MSLDTYVAMWDCQGLECLVNWTEISRRRTWQALAGQPLSDIPNVNMMQLRAQFNPQRNYEIYKFSVDRSVSVEDLRNMFDTDPQHIVNLIRKHGESIYSNRENPAKRKII